MAYGVGRTLTPRPLPTLGHLGLSSWLVREASSIYAPARVWDHGSMWSLRSTDPENPNTDLYSLSLEKETGTKYDTEKHERNFEKLRKMFI